MASASSRAASSAASVQARATALSSSRSASAAAAASAHAVASVSSHADSGAASAFARAFASVELSASAAASASARAFAPASNRAVAAAALASATSPISPSSSSSSLSASQKQSALMVSSSGRERVVDDANDAPLSAVDACANTVEARTIAHSRLAPSNNAWADERRGASRGPSADARRNSDEAARGAVGSALRTITLRGNDAVSSLRCHSWPPPMEAVPRGPPPRPDASVTPATKNTRRGVATVAMPYALSMLPRLLRRPVVLRSLEIVCCDARQSAGLCVADDPSV